MPPSDDLSEYLSALNANASQQKIAEARKREQELAHAKALAELKAQDRAEEERLLKLRIQVAEAAQAAQETAKRVPSRPTVSLSEDYACRWDETPQEHAKRLTALGLVEVGRFTFDPHAYDVCTGLFPLPQKIEWEQGIPADSRPPEGLIWKAVDREAARAAVGAGQLRLLATLAAHGKTFAIKDYAIIVAERPYILMDRGCEETKAIIYEILADMIAIRPGSVKSEGRADVRVDMPFSICRFPVLQSWYERVMKANPSDVKGPRKPVNNVNWFDAVEFCEKLKVAAKRYSPNHPNFQFGLPTHSQWEFACRAGSSTRLGRASDNRNAHLSEMAWFLGNSRGQIQDAGLTLPNAFGLYDMLGNVWEWCEDSVHGNQRILCGGDWRSPEKECHAGNCGWDEPGYNRFRAGFRPVLLWENGRKPEITYF